MIGFITVSSLHSKMCRKLSLNLIESLSKFKNTQKVVITSKCLYSSNGSDLKQQKKFDEIFRLPIIPIGYALHKMKWYNTLILGAVIPTVSLMYLNNVIDYDMLRGIAFGGCTIVGNTYGIGTLFEKAIGFMYLSEDESIVKISYLDFWGNRVDEEYLVKDVVPFCDAPRTMTNFLYKTIIFYSEDSLKLKLCLRYGKITDKDKFLKVFGSFDDK